MNDILYWIEGGNKTIMSCVVSTKKCQVLEFQEISTPVAITIFKSSTLYVAHDRILASVNVNGSDHRKLRDETTEVRYLQVYDDQSRKGMCGE